MYPDSADILPLQFLKFTISADGKELRVQKEKDLWGITPEVNGYSHKDLMDTISMCNVWIIFLNCFILHALDRGKEKLSFPF